MLIHSSIKQRSRYVQYDYKLNWLLHYRRSYQMLKYVPCYMVIFMEAICGAVQHGRNFLQNVGIFLVEDEGSTFCWNLSNFIQAERGNILEDSNLQSHCCKNLKSKTNLQNVKKSRWLLTENTPTMGQCLPTDNYIHHSLALCEILLGFNCLAEMLYVCTCDRLSPNLGSY
jgi:hypothetical protein